MHVLSSPRGGMRSIPQCLLFFCACSNFAASAHLSCIVCKIGAVYSNGKLLGGCGTRVKAKLEEVGFAHADGRCGGTLNEGQIMSESQSSLGSVGAYASSRGSIP